MTNYSKELVVSRFNEDVSWLTHVCGYKIALYNKGNFIVSSTELPNVGREMQTYFHHIVENYNNLSDITFFTQGSPFDHVSNYNLILEMWPHTKSYSKLTFGDGGFFFTNGVFKTPLECNSIGYPHHFDVLDVDYIWKSLFNGSPPSKYRFVAGAIFAATKEQIQLRSLEFYKKCLDLSVSRKTGPWEFERFLPIIFDSTYTDTKY